MSQMDNVRDAAWIAAETALEDKRQRPIMRLLVGGGLVTAVYVLWLERKYYHALKEYNQRKKKEKEAGGAVTTAAQDGEKHNGVAHKYDLTQEEAGKMASYLVENPHLKRGYRPTGMSMTECIKSVFWYHNETVNIWSHALGSLYFLYRLRNARHMPVKVVCAGAVWTYGVSAVSHMMHSHSENVSEACFLCDRASIANLVWASSIAVAMTHLRGPNDGPALVAALTASTGLYAGIAHGVVKGAEKEKLVAMLSIQTFSTIVVPVLRELYQRKSPNIARLVWYYLTRTLSVYMIGAAVFIYRFPECVAPGWFCRCGQSHNLMHLLVVLGSSLTSKGIADWCDEVGYLK